MNAESVKFDKAFDAIAKAAAAPRSHTLVNHMWERKPKDWMSEKEKADWREIEMSRLLPVMFDNPDPNALYDDRDFMVQKKDRNTLYGMRWQKPHSEGAIGLACSPISSVARIPQLCDRSKTGIMLLDSAPVVVTPYDAWSVYYQEKEGLPKQVAYDYMTEWCRQYQKDIPTPINWEVVCDPNMHPNILDGVFIDEENRSVPGWHYLGDHPEERKHLAGHIISSRVQYDSPLFSLMEKQGANKYMPYFAVDPHQPERKEIARECYTELMEAINSGAYVPPSGEVDCEVDVNAHLSNIAAITLYNDDQHIDLSVPANLAETLAKYPKLVDDFYHALHEYDYVTDFMAKHPEHAPKNPPTLVICQPNAKEKLVHMPPTEQLRTTVNDARRSREVGDDPAKTVVASSAIIESELSQPAAAWAR